MLKHLHMHPITIAHRHSDPNDGCPRKIYRASTHPRYICETPLQHDRECLLLPCIAR